LFERARPRKSTTRLAPARRLWRGGGHVGVVGAAKLGSDLEATNRAVGVSGSAHTKAALARGRDAVVEGDASVVEADVEERRLLGVNDGGLAQDGLRRRRLVQEAVGRRQEQGSYEIGLRIRATRSEGAGVTRCRLDGVKDGKVHRGLFRSSQRRRSEFEQAKLGAARGRDRCVHFRALAACETHFLGLYPSFFNENNDLALCKTLAPSGGAWKRNETPRIHAPRRPADGS